MSGDVSGVQLAGRKGGLSYTYPFFKIEKKLRGFLYEIDEIDEKVVDEIFIETPLF